MEEKGQLHNPKDGKLATLKVEAWCDSDLYVWHWFAGRAGTTNDKTMVSISPLFQDILTGKYPFQLKQPYKVLSNSISRYVPYFLADGIYPQWPLFILPIHMANSVREQRYTRAQEGRRKDIERAFGVLQARFNILRYEDKRWYKSEIIKSSRVCVILHNMIVRMSQTGLFASDIESEEEEFNIISEMYDDEKVRAIERK